MRAQAVKSRFGVRVRTTIVATVVVILGMTAAALFLVNATRAALTRSVETTVTARSADLAAQAAAGGTPDVLPLVHNISAQLVSNSEVVASTPDIEGQARIVNVNVAASVIITTKLPTLDAEQNDSGEGNDETEGPFLVAVTGVSGTGDVVIAAGSLSTVTGTTRALVPLLALMVPAISLLAGFTVWRLTSRAFQPVDAMMRQAERISYGDLHVRVPVPEPKDEIRHLAEVLNGMLDRLEASVTRQQRLVADAGHELRSPVATLLTMGEVAEANPHLFDPRSLAADVVSQTRRLASLVEDLLVIARSDDPDIELSRRPIDVSDLIREEAALRIHEAISVQAEASRPTIAYADRRRLGQVVRNLLDNAIRHASSVVRMATTSADGTTTITVADDGPGIPEDERDQIFERFVRLDEARSRDSGGTGLGLAVARSLVEAHGGSIGVSTDPELGGALFKVTLPAAGP